MQHVSFKGISCPEANLLWEWIRSKIKNDMLDNVHLNETQQVLFSILWNRYHNTKRQSTIKHLRKFLLLGYKWHVRCTLEVAISAAHCRQLMGINAEHYYLRSVTGGRRGARDPNAQRQNNNCCGN